MLPKSKSASFSAQRMDIRKSFSPLKCVKRHAQDVNCFAGSSCLFMQSPSSQRGICAKKMPSESLKESSQLSERQRKYDQQSAFALFALLIAILCVAVQHWITALLVICGLMVALCYADPTRRRRFSTLGESREELYGLANIEPSARSGPLELLVRSIGRAWMKFLRA